MGNIKKLLSNLLIQKGFASDEERADKVSTLIMIGIIVFSLITIVFLAQPDKAPSQYYYDGPIDGETI